MDNKCLICQQENPEQSHWWKAHKLKQADYYQKYYPRKDLFSGELIPFKSLDSYLLSDFTDKRNLKKYIETSLKEDALKYLKNWLIKRSNIKNIRFAPGEFEAKSLFFPSINYIENYFGKGTYESICDESGIFSIYNYDTTLVFDCQELNFIGDTREQNYIKLPNIQIQKLDFGDYSIENNTKKIFIERKSLNDFIGTMSAGFERFKKEIIRCQENNSYLIILIEEKYNNIMSFPYLPHTKHAKASVDFICHQFRELINTYKNDIQFLAVDGRMEAARVIEKIFLLNNNIRKIDLQFFYNKKEL